jgi:hypothetical protein
MFKFASPQLKTCKSSQKRKIWYTPTKIQRRSSTVNKTDLKISKNWPLRQKDKNWNSGNRKTLKIYIRTIKLKTNSGNLVRIITLALIATKKDLDPGLVKRAERAWKSKQTDRTMICKATTHTVWTNSSIRWQSERTERCQDRRRWIYHSTCRESDHHRTRPTYRELIRIPLTTGREAIVRAQIGGATVSTWE